MKFLFSFFLTLFFSASLFAQGIQFEKFSWAEALVEAQKENKLIFIDAYTTWCGPCKLMSKKVFTEGAVGELYNDAFINLKIDMEKGEGPNLAREYEVRAYPTLLFVDGSGTLVHRSAGYHDKEKFIELGSIAMDSDMRLSSMEKKFADGNRDADFLMKYTKARFNAHDGSHSPIAEAYLNTQGDWSTPENMVFLYQYTEKADNKLFDYLLENRDMFGKVFGEREVKSRIQEIIYNSIYDSADKSSLEQIDELFKKAYPENAEELSARFRLTFYRQAGDREAYAKAAANFLDKFPNQSPDELNEISWTFYQVVEDKKLLKKAVKWIKRSIKADDQYYNNDTLAALYYKLKKKRKARKVAEKAISIAKANDEDSTETEKLLEAINKL